MDATRILMLNILPELKEYEVLLQKPIVLVHLLSRFASSNVCPYLHAEAWLVCLLGLSTSKHTPANMLKRLCQAGIAAKFKMANTPFHQVRRYLRHGWWNSD